MLDVRPTMQRLVIEAAEKVRATPAPVEIEGMRGYFVALASFDLPEGAHLFFSFKVQDEDYKVFVVPSQM
jgi:hypothetical protein